MLRIWGVVCTVVRGRGKDGRVSLSAINAHTSRTLRNSSDYVTALGVSERQEIYIYLRVHGECFCQRPYGTRHFVSKKAHLSL